VSEYLYDQKYHVFNLKGKHHWSVFKILNAVCISMATQILSESEIGLTATDKTLKLQTAAL